MSKPRILHCITVYNGRDFVPAAITSALRIDQTDAVIDILILDDASPDPGWSAALQRICADSGIKYYRSPRNLGIPRNVNLGLLAAVEHGYDYVVVSNSDVLYPRALMSELLAASRHKDVGSVTAWSNNVSAYALPNADPNRYLQDQEVVDWMDATLHGHFGDAVMDIPAGISFCMLISTGVVREVGLMDPCFGRGYCEETDWSLRSVRKGYRIGLAVGTFVYHRGGGSNHAAGLISGNQTTVSENEAIIDLRYPQFRAQVGNFLESGILEKAWSDATQTVIKSAATQFGYSLELDPTMQSNDAEQEVQVAFPSLQSPETPLAIFRGFRHQLPSAANDLASITKWLGLAPKRIILGGEDSAYSSIPEGYRKLIERRKLPEYPRYL